MRKKFLSALIFSASALGVGVVVGADEPQEKDKKEFKVKAVVVDGGEEPKGQKSETAYSFTLPLVNKLWLGVGLKSVEGDLSDFLGSDEGVLVEDVHDGSPASKAGIMKGDILLSINETKLGGPGDLLEFMKTAKEGQALKLKLRRKNEEKEVEATPAARPKELSATFDLSEAIGEGNLQFQIDPINMEVFRMGSPAGIFVPQGLPAGDFQLNLNSTQDGKSVEVKVTRKGDKPAEITVTKDGETKNYTEDNLDKVPEDIRGWVGSMIKPGGRSIVGLGELPNLSSHVQGLRIDAGSLNERLEAIVKDAKLSDEAHEALKHALEGFAASADSAKAAAKAFNSQEMRERFEELRKRAMEEGAKAAAEARKSVVEAAKHAEAANLARISARDNAKSENKQVEELRQLVGELKKEIAELRAASKKDKND